MVVPPSTGGGCSPANPTARPAATNTMSSNSPYKHFAPHIPFSLREAPKLDMSTVERKGQSTGSRETSKRVRPHGLQEAPTFRPTAEEFQDPMEYVKKIAPEGRKYGICKIIPPDTWNPPFAIDTQKFHFRTRKQELNSVEGSTRSNLNYLDQLSKFHKQSGGNLNRFPSVDKRPLDLYKLKKAVEVRGGFENVCKLKKWAEIGRDLGYSGKIMSSLSTSLKNSYQKWLHPYEEYLRVARPGVQQQLELEYGGGLSPSPANTPARQSQQATPHGPHKDSPVLKSAAALNEAVGLPESNVMDADPAVAPRPSSGFTRVNNGFTPVNLTPPSFKPVNTSVTSIKWDKDTSNRTVRQHSESTPHSVKGTPDLPTGLAPPLNATNGHGSQHPKRTISHESTNGAVSRPESPTNDDSESQGRRSKRQKKDNVPTVAGSHMSLLRPLVPRMSGAPRQPPSFAPGSKAGGRCEGCGQIEDPSALVVCDSCDIGYHRSCMDPSLKATARDWHCPKCLVGTGEFGFEEGGIYGLRQFQEKANNFKDSYFGPRMPFDPILNCKRAVTEDEVEREFWRLVESITETVEVEYGADIHSTTHGSGFPEVEKDPLNPYARDPWNLNILPLHFESLFRHIRSDISGMTVPWLYVGMVFSTFCWHNEDHYTYSANYQHFGATKTWYGIPGDDAERFEQAMKQAVPELFEQQPDLLFQLVTLLPPDQLKKAGVNVYALDQRAGQFVITFPQAYHAGFNHGFNFNEAVNFAPSDWEPYGRAGVERLQEFRRQPCFSHDELLLTAANRDTTIKSAKWLSPALQRLRDRELTQRQDFLKRHMEFNDHHCKVDGEVDKSGIGCGMGFERDDLVLPEEEYQCAHCKAYTYLSRYQCHKTDRIMCVLHAGVFACCGTDEEQRHTSSDHTLRYRLSDEELRTTVKKIEDRANIPEAWQKRLDELLEDDPKPPLRHLRALVNEGDRIPYDLPGLADLRSFVERCNEWVEEATNYITRKQQNRRKNERAWRRGTNSKTNDGEDRDKELRKVNNINKLLAQAEEISFDCPEIHTLRERAEDISNFQEQARNALRNPSVRSTQEFEELIELGKGFYVDLPEVDELGNMVRKLKWDDRASEMRAAPQTLSNVADLLKRGQELQISENDPLLLHWRGLKEKGDIWERKANELINTESTPYHQLDALCNQANVVPVNPETRSAIDQKLAKQREAHKNVLTMFEKCKDPDFRKRPLYKDVRQVLDSLAELNSKPSGTVDLEKEVKRHEDWMRKGKKLFGKSNAPLHILMCHMMAVRERNNHCFDLDDKPRMPVEPASREPSIIDGEEPEHGQNAVFCLCRLPENGTMIECDLCHEWYHSRCLKMARGKVKEDENYNCPVCDYRVKIPRDAARPNLEDLLDWRDEIPFLPFQPEEEGVLNEIIGTAQEFRDYVVRFKNSYVAAPEDVTTQRFYLRKIEGADILLADETNFFRAEVHRWAPVTRDPPPVIKASLSTRKPRPTKQQKLMARHGVQTPEELPQELRTKPHTFRHHRKSIDSSSRAPHPLQPAPQFSNRSGVSNGAPTSGTSTEHKFRPPPPLSTSHQDPTYSGMFATSPQTNSASELATLSPPLVWQNPSPNLSNQSAALNSPLFRPVTPTSSGAPLDPSLFSPSNASFAAAALREVSNAQAMVSPMRDRGYSHSRGNSGGGDMENLFANFTNDANDEPSRNEAGEALEGLGVVGGSSHEEEQARKLADEFLARE